MTYDLMPEPNVSSSRLRAKITGSHRGAAVRDGDGDDSSPVPMPSGTIARKLAKVASEGDRTEWIAGRFVQRDMSFHSGWSAALTPRDIVLLVDAWRDVVIGFRPAVTHDKVENGVASTHNPAWVALHKLGVPNLLFTSTVSGIKIAYEHDRPVRFHYILGRPAKASTEPTIYEHGIRKPVSQSGVPLWLECLQCGDLDRPPAALLMALFDEIQSLLWQEQFDQLDQILGHVRPDRMAVATMLGVLRYSFGGKKRLVRWAEIFLKIERELVRRGRNTEVILRGLRSA